jgi:hypothetical protein
LPQHSLLARAIPQSDAKYQETDPRKCDSCEVASSRHGISRFAATSVPSFRPYPPRTQMTLMLAWIVYYQIVVIRHYRR